LIVPKPAAAPRFMARHDRPETDHIFPENDRVSQKTDHVRAEGFKKFRLSWNFIHVHQL
jgi:hypothetical protein